MIFLSSSGTSFSKNCGSSLEERRWSRKSCPRSTALTLEVITVISISGR